MRNRKLLYRVFAMVLCICMVSTSLNDVAIAFDLGSISKLFGADEPSTRSSSATQGVTRQADPSTMDTYQTSLNFSENTRYAGRIWSDKTVFANGERYTGDESTKDPGRVFDGTNLTLTPALDGVSSNTKVPLDEDFLHVYSVLGSSEQKNESVASPIDLVMLLDMSAVI